MDLVIVFVKAMYTMPALEANRRVIGPHPYLMTLQNGAGHEARPLNFADQGHVIIGTTQHNGSLTGKDIVKQGGGGKTSMGLLAGNSERVQQVADAFTASGLECAATNEVKKQIWTKLFLNTSASALTAILQVPLGCILEDPYASKLMETLAGTLLFARLLCFLVRLFIRSKTGIMMSSSGGNPMFGTAIGIHNDKMRIIGSVISTVPSTVGILVHAQSFGFHQLYNAPIMMVYPAISAVLIGGATTKQASIANVVIGCILFRSILSVLSIAGSGQSATFIMQEPVSRICRNAVLILSLLMPVLCGMGLNFSIVLGAAAGQNGFIPVTHWSIGGLGGVLACVAIASGLSALFGLFAGSVFNRTVGQKLITGMIVDYFAKGVFDLAFLKLFGKTTPMDNPALILTGGVGLKNTNDCNDNSKYVFDRVWQMPLLDTVLYATIAAAMVLLIVLAVRVVFRKTTCREALRKSRKLLIAAAALAAGYCLLLTVPPLLKAACTVQVPVFTALIIAGVCLITIHISRAQLGQAIRTCGQNVQAAAFAGIRVGRTRIIATIISAAFAAWGQIICLQNMSLVNIYTSHEQAGMYAVAVLLVGGVSIKMVIIGQVFLGALLFRVLFFTMPLAGLNQFSDAQIGEYFRVFASCDVIAASLARYA